MPLPQFLLEFESMHRSGLFGVRTTMTMLLASLLATGCISNRARPMTGRGLVELDESWAAAAASDDLDAIMDFWTESAVMYAPNVPPLYGKKAIRELLEHRRSQPDYRITWVPGCAGIDERGSMAYTLGEGTVTLPDESGVAREFGGRYVAIWRNDGDRWRCAVKCWTPAPRTGAKVP